MRGLAKNLAAALAWLALMLPGIAERAHAAVNPTFTPVWNVGDQWQVETSGVLVHDIKEVGAVEFAGDLGIGAVYDFEVVSIDPTHYHVVVSSRLRPDESYELLIRVADFTLESVNWQQRDGSGEVIGLEHPNPAPSPEFALFLGLDAGIPLDFPNMPSSNVDEIRTVAVTPYMDVTQTVTFSGNTMVVEISADNNGGLFLSRQTWEAGQKWWSSAERTQAGELQSAGTLLSSAMPDSDGDGLDNGTEQMIGTGETVGDSDGDGFSDYQEHVVIASDPLDPGDPGTCNDGIDNDGDGATDFPADAGCTDANDLSEVPDCSDGIDNDGDGAFDFPGDPGCRKPSWPTENPACSDGIDNDGDTFIDYPNDPGCYDAAATREDPACNDGIDNDLDGRIDLNDPQCGNAWASNERGSCGLGGELAFLLPPLMWLHRRTRSRRRSA